MNNVSKKKAFKYSLMVNAYREKSKDETETLEITFWKTMGETLLSLFF